MKKKIKNLVVGSGLSGAIIAERIASILGEEVLVIDRRNHLGGNCFDYFDNNKICIHKYGPHIFHTEIEQVWQYLNNFTKFNNFEFKPQVIIDGKPCTLPFNLNTLHQVFEKSKADFLEKKLVQKYGKNGKISILELKNEGDKDLKELSEFVYKKVFEGYTVKQWGLKPEKIDHSVTARVPVMISCDDRYFQDKYQGIPENGYTKMIENILNHPKIEIRLNVDFHQSDFEYEKLFFTGAIDEFFGYKFGKLPYRSLHFDIEEKNTEYFQNAAMVNYPCDFDFTRITEHKYFLGTKSPKTVVSYEYPQEFELGKNERYYPISNPENQALYEKYLQEAKKLKNVYFLGRLGDYKYYNMDLTVERALNLFKGVK
ncbi:MAG TPA: UDP-galactopyranose mutase [Candidatus Gastranaerophilaceae bacterium]|nr:UDP-galactopyranose mutase [Candidatus Gastranaerophilaceae bacterium]HPT41839.1 UDP-galactopyranose mutase [Candidatus Gastranaerophilaceae bacterium]